MPGHCVQFQQVRDALQVTDAGLFSRIKTCCWQLTAVKREQYNCFKSMLGHAPNLV